MEKSNVHGNVTEFVFSLRKFQYVFSMNHNHKTLYRITNLTLVCFQGRTSLGQKTKFRNRIRLPDTVAGWRDTSPRR